MRSTHATYPAGYVDRTGTGDDVIRELIRWLQTTVPKSSSVVISPGIDNTSNSPVVLDLQRQGVPVVTWRQFSNAVMPRRPAALLLWPNIRALHDIEKRSPAAVAVAPWGLDELEVWVKSRRPMDVLSGQTASGPNLSPMVQAAVESIVSLTNPNNGLNSHNKGYAVEILKRLRKHDHEYSPGDVGAFLAASGWQLDDAHELVAIAQRIIDGKTVQGRGPLNPKILSVWKERAARISAERES